MRVARSPGFARNGGFDMTLMLALCAGSWVPDADSTWSALDATEEEIQVYTAAVKCLPRQ